MIRKINIILIGIVTLLLLLWVTHASTTYWIPEFSIIEDKVQHTVTNTGSLILPDQENASQFCFALNQELDNYQEWQAIADYRAYYDNTSNTWKESVQSYTGIIDSITCKIPESSLFTIHKPSEHPKKVTNGESLFEFDSSLIKVPLWEYDWLEEESFATQNSGLITGTILNGSGSIETVTLDISWMTENPQTKELMKLLYDIRLVLVILFWFFLFFKFYDYISKFFYFLR